MALKFKADIDMKALNSLKKKTRDLKKPITRDFARRIGQVTVKEMKKLIKKGLSPLKGAGSFPAYRGSYGKQITKKGYVIVGGTKYRKKLRPVNLKLTGDFLKSLKYRVVKGKTGFDTKVGYFKLKSIDKEEGHRTGHNEQAERPTIPQRRLKEDFKRTISEKYVGLIDKAIAKVANRKR